MTLSPTLCVRNLHYAYPDGTMALNGVSFDLHFGEAVALVGANGAGKSTLLLHLCGCLPVPDNTLYVDNQPLDGTKPTFLRQHVGMVFQNSDDQLFMPTVYEDVAFGPLNMGLPADEVETRVKEALSTVGGDMLLARPPYRLSGGEKRLVAIAGVLAMAPKVLILDEPTSNLDPKGRRRFINVLRSFSQTRLVATHDLDMALELCPRTLIMQQGIIRADGPTKELLSNETLLEECSLERPALLR